ncbi:MAG: hypothetical protein WD749_08915 [Phycisphaerales bacterium]
MPIDPRELRPTKRTFVDIVDTDRPCGRCGYSLRGLPTNGKCPECGLPIGHRARKGARRFADNLTDAPLMYLKTLAWGAGLLAVCSVVAAVGLSVLVRTGSPVAAAVAGAASIGWWTGVFICTAQRPIDVGTLRDVFLESVPLRWTNRVLQSAWPAAAVAYFAATRAPAPMDEVFGWAGLMLQIIALIGLIPLSVQLSSLGDWAGDTGLADRFRLAASLLAIFGVVAVASAIVRKAELEGIWLAVRIAGIWAWLGMVCVELLFLFCLYQLANISVWAIRNSVTAHEVATRIAARQGDVLAHRECAECGYDLAGLSVYDRCPECGHLDESVKQSGLFALRQVREAAEGAVADDSPIPLVGKEGRPPLRITSPEPIKAGRRQPPRPAT